VRVPRAVPLAMSACRRAMMRALVPGVEHVADQHRGGRDDGGDHGMLDPPLGMVQQAVPAPSPESPSHRRLRGPRQVFLPFGDLSGFLSATWAGCFFAWLPLGIDA
jgi:hypothetical protein